MSRGAANAAKTHCPRDHEYTAENTGRSARGQRYCKRCARDRMRVTKGWVPGVDYVAPDMSVEFAWAVGLFEGEGCTSVQAAVSKEGRVYVRMTLGMTDRDVVERFQRAIGGIGRISTRKPRGNSQQLYVWTLSKQAEIRTLITSMYHMLSLRRQAQADQAISRSTWRAAS